MARTLEAARFLVMTAIAAAAVGSIGCVRKPVISVHHAEVRAASLQGVGVAVFLEIDNENAYDVQVRSVHAEVTIAGRHALAPIDLTPNKWLPSHETTMIPVEVWIPWALVPALIAETAGSLEIAYFVRGKADVTAVRALGIQRNDYPVSEEGAIPRQVVIDAARRALPFF